MTTASALINQYSFLGLKKAIDKNAPIAGEFYDLNLMFQRDGDWLVVKHPLNKSVSVTITNEGLIACQIESPLQYEIVGRLITEQRLIDQFYNA